MITQSDLDIIKDKEPKTFLHPKGKILSKEIMAYRKSSSYYYTDLNYCFDKTYNQIKGIVNKIEIYKIGENKMIVISLAGSDSYIMYHKCASAKELKKVFIDGNFRVNDKIYGFKYKTDKVLDIIVIKKYYNIKFPYFCKGNNLLVRYENKIQKWMNKDIYQDRWDWNERGSISCIYKKQEEPYYKIIIFNKGNKTIKLFYCKNELLIRELSCLINEEEPSNCFENQSIDFKYEIKTSPYYNIKIREITEYTNKKQNCFCSIM